jgi:hypothetical protein
MTVRTSERRIPATLQPTDLGEAVATGDARAVLVSYITSPLVVERDNVYVLFVVDETLAESTSRYEWTFASENAEPDRRQTDVGEISFRPKTTGDLRVTARLLNDGGAEQASLTLSQEVVDPNGELEGLIEAARNEPGPGVGNPQVARELINDHTPHAGERRFVPGNDLRPGVGRRSTEDAVSTRRTAESPRRVAEFGR